MYTSLVSAKFIPGAPSTAEVDPPPIVVELTKKAHFCRFLEKEMNTAKTEAEKEAVQSILMKTKVEIRAIERKWKRAQAALHRSSRAASKKIFVSGFETPRIQ